MSPTGSELLFVALVAAAGCAEEPDPIPTEAVCPDGGTTLTYESFGAPFMDAYCTRCHDSALTGADRHGAPAFHDFDTFGGIIAVANHVDWWAGAGPAAVNTLMPPDAPAPSLDERYQLSEWLACELENR